jgi:integrase
MGVTITNKKGQLYISYTKSNQRKLFSIKPQVKVEPAQIDIENLTINTGNRKKDKELNLILQNNYNWFLDTIERLEKFEKTQATVTLISRLHQQEFLTEKKAAPKTFDQALEAYLDNKRDVEGMKGLALLEYTQNFVKRIRGFLNAYNYKTIDEINEDFLHKFSKHLLDLEYSKATYSLTTSVFKNFCKYLVDKKLIPAETLLSARDILKSKTYANIKDFALTIKEVKELYEFKGVLKAQVYYKDLFVFNCIAGGMRYSDLRKIKVGDLDLEKNILHVYTQKTKTYVTIPLIPLAIEIIRKHRPDLETVDKDSYLFKIGTS